MRIGGPGGTKNTVPGLSVPPPWAVWALHHTQTTWNPCFWAAFPWILHTFHHFAAPEYLKTLENQRTIYDFPMILLFQATLYWSALISTDQHWSILIANGQHWSTLINTDQHWSPLMDIDQHRHHWPTLFNVVQHWSTLFNIDHHWWTLIGHAILFHSIPSPPLCVHQRSRNPHTGFWKLRNLLRPSYPLGIWLSIRSSTLPQNQSL